MVVFIVLCLGVEFLCCEHLMYIFTLTYVFTLTACSAYDMFPYLIVNLLVLFPPRMLEWEFLILPSFTSMMAPT